MAVNYEIKASAIDVRIRPDEFIGMKVEFVVFTPGCRNPELVAEAVRKAIVAVAGDLQVVAREEGYLRCIYCGKKNKADALECQFCGGHV